MRRPEPKALPGAVIPSTVLSEPVARGAGIGAACRDADAVSLRRIAMRVATPFCSVSGVTSTVGWTRAVWILLNWNMLDWGVVGLAELVGDSRSSSLMLIRLG